MYNDVSKKDEYEIPFPSGPLLHWVVSVPLQFAHSRCLGSTLVYLFILSSVECIYKINRNFVFPDVNL